MGSFFIIIQNKYRILLAVLFCQMVLCGCLPPTGRTSTPISPTINPSTPAPPADQWVEFFYSPDANRFVYPSNWFLSLKSKENKVILSNAPPGGIYAQKQAGDFFALSVDLMPSRIDPGNGLEGWVTINKISAISPSMVLLRENLPLSQYGLPAYRLITSGPGETEAVFLRKGNFVSGVSLTYPAGQRDKIRYFPVFEKVIRSLHMP